MKYLFSFLFLFFLFSFPSSAATFISSGIQNCPNGTYVYPYFYKADGSAIYRFRPVLCDDLNTTGFINYGSICNQPYYSSGATSTYVCGTTSNNGSWDGTGSGFTPFRANLAVPEAYPSSTIQEITTTTNITVVASTTFFALDPSMYSFVVWVFFVCTLLVCVFIFLYYFTHHTPRNPSPHI